MCLGRTSLDMTPLWPSRYFFCICGVREVSWLWEKEICGLCRVQAPPLIALLFLSWSFGQQRMNLQLLYPGGTHLPPASDPPSNMFPTCLPRTSCSEPLCLTQPAFPCLYPVCTADLCLGLNSMDELGEAALQASRGLGTGRWGSTSGKFPWQAVPRRVWWVALKNPLFPIQVQPA